MVQVDFAARNLIDAVPFLQTIIAAHENSSRLTAASFKQAPGRAATAAPIIKGTVTFLRETSDPACNNFRN